MLDIQGFRLNVAIVLINNKDQVFLAKRIKQNAWQLPQGGVNENEDLLTALYRELYEEIGIDNKSVSIIASTKQYLRYKLPVRMRRKKNLADNSVDFIGQKQKWFLLRFNGNEDQIRFDLSSKPEFDAWQWVSFWYPLHVVVDFKKLVYLKGLRELSTYIYSNKKYNRLDHICC